MSQFPFNRNIYIFGDEIIIQIIIIYFGLRGRRTIIRFQIQQPFRNNKHVNLKK